jgi:dedicator of cytokinesis protein 1
LGPAPWALSYLKLVNDSNGTTVKDGYHDLLVYKVEKKFDFSNPTYLDLPSLKTNSATYKAKLMPYNNFLSLITKDVLTVHTTLCSTKLTQNLGLLSLLKWRSEPDNLRQNLTVFAREVKAAEVVKFLPDVLDALFSILMENSDSELYDNLVFEALIAVIGMVTADKFKQFVPVLEVYINENYSATLAYNKLLVVFKDYVEAAIGGANNRIVGVGGGLPLSATELKRRTEKLAQAMQALPFLFKFVVKSRLLFAALNGGKGTEPFEGMLRDVLLSLVKLMFGGCGSQSDLLTIQSACLKHIVLTVPDLVQVFPRRNLAEILMKMMTALPAGQLTEQKLDTLRWTCTSLRIFVTNNRIFY